MSETPANPMKYPYTFTAKIMQFPYKFHYQNQWFYRYMVFGWLATLPIMYKIHKLANSPGNKKVWEERRRKEQEELHHH